MTQQVPDHWTLGNLTDQGKEVHTISLIHMGVTLAFRVLSISAPQARLNVIGTMKQHDLEQNAQLIKILFNSIVTSSREVN